MATQSLELASFSRLLNGRTLTATFTASSAIFQTCMGRETNLEKRNFEVFKTFKEINYFF